MNESLWKRVEDALDERRDPLQDPRLARELAADSMALAEVQRLVRRLDSLAGGVSAIQHRARRRRAVVAAGLAAGVAASALLIALGRGFRAGTAPAPRAVGADLSVSLVVERTTPEPARCERVVLAPKHVLAWTLEGERP
jgi:peptidoglycan/LPS O-acetylase OafA/YrhL